MSISPINYQGEKAKVPGIYDIIGPRGGVTGKQITVVKGETLPPTPKPNEAYKIAEKPKHGRKG
jgi:hypothetical protein